MTLEDSNEEEKKKEQRRIEDEQAEYWLEQIAKEEAARVPEKNPEQVELERTLTEIETIFEHWMDPEKLASLNALESEKDAMESPLRTQAKQALGTLMTKKKWLQTTLPKEKLDKMKEQMDEIEAKRAILGKAVGMINGGKVDHTRG